MSDALIVLKNIGKRYTRGKQQVRIFDHLDMAIPRQDFVAMMGPSGSGKTTLLNLLAAFRAANVGFVFQFYNLMPMLTAAQNVELPLLLTKLGPKARRERVQTALTIVNLADRARHKPSELSGGQQQRVAIARAIVSDPKLLLCDEPTGDLDRETADEILGMLQTLNRDLGKTIVMVTHDPEAARFAKRTLHLDKGHFVEKDLNA